MAEREGFEPSVEFLPYTRLAGVRLKPARPPLQKNGGGRGIRTPMGRTRRFSRPLSYQLELFLHSALNSMSKFKNYSFGVKRFFIFFYLCISCTGKIVTPASSPSLRLMTPLDWITFLLFALPSIDKTHPSRVRV